MYDNVKYDVPKKWISSFVSKGRTWEWVDYAGNENDEQLKAFLANQEETQGWDPFSPEEWHGLVKHVRAINADARHAFIGSPAKPLKAIPTGSRSCWQLYRKKLQKKHFTEESIVAIEEATQRVISQISAVTPQTDPVRGMVMGNVQSGKTANMAAVIEMAADYGFNFFIVMTGTIENLRKQTQKRLLSDLKNPEDYIHFEALENPCATPPVGQRLQDLLLDEGSTTRYLCVCLKNGTRLKDLLTWLNANDPNKGKLKILLLDDEADQAGINTANLEKNLAAPINKYLRNIVFAEDKNGKPTHRYGAMNYIGYTATPYGNLLNEANDRSLYPKNFIMCLPSPAEYFGPQEIFGLIDQCDGLPIINRIEVPEIQSIAKHISFGYADVPPAFEKAILWFVCCLATARHWQLKQPFTMLIHTSQKIVLHSEMESSVAAYFDGLRKNDYLQKTREVWEEQTKQLTLNDFFEGMPNYHDKEKVKNYPDFDLLAPEIKKIIEGGLSHIKMADDQAKYEFGEKIHLCVDNCSQNAVDGNIVMRIVYPEKEDLENLSCAPGFIVIGGATLSRGLTLEGLTCSYFLRTTKMADTLMQMGRWFGYRKGYELLPRIWLSQAARDQYTRLSLLDYDLRHEIDVMADMNLAPEQYGPRIDSFPDYRALVITAAKKMQKAQTIEVAFGNKSGQTTKFSKDNGIIKDNLNYACEFVDALGPVDQAAIDALNNPYIDAKHPAYEWFDVDYEFVFDFLDKLQFPPQVATLGDVKKVKEWFKTEYKAGHLKNWDVVLATTTSGRTRDFKHVSVHMPVRAQLNQKKPGTAMDPNYIYLRTITAPSDMFLDIDTHGLSDKVLEALKQKDINLLNQYLGKKNASMAEKRIAFNKFDTPLLVLYFIDKQSGEGDPKCQPQNGEEPTRAPLGTDDDLFGYYVYIPYGAGGDGKPLIVSNSKVAVE
ncbi:MAG: Z1 domain-containing protein, partial [Bacilli bacterium]|nr:Z1 domain-containing protein [Bacilli bacterium]